MTFYTEKQIEEKLERETRQLKTSDDKCRYVTMTKLKWECLKVILYITSLERVVERTLFWCDHYGYTFEEYFPVYVAWYYNNMYK